MALYRFYTLPLTVLVSRHRVILSNGIWSSFPSRDGIQPLNTYPVVGLSHRSHLLPTNTERMSTPAKIDHLVQTLAETISNINKSRYTSAAGLAIVLYDILLLLSDGSLLYIVSLSSQPTAEVRLVWQKQRRSLARYAYLINRYVPPLFLIVANFRKPIPKLLLCIYMLTQVLLQNLLAIVVH